MSENRRRVVVGVLMFGVFPVLFVGAMIFIGETSDPEDSEGAVVSPSVLAIAESGSTTSQSSATSTSTSELVTSATGALVGTVAPSSTTTSASEVTSATATTTAPATTATTVATPTSGTVGSSGPASTRGTVRVTTTVPVVPLVGPFESYTVQPGDWLLRVAGRYGVTAAQLALLNDLDDPDLIRPGQVLQVPRLTSSGTTTTSATTTTVASTATSATTTTTVGPTTAVATTAVATTVAPTVLGKFDFRPAGEVFDWTNPAAFRNRSDTQALQETQAAIDQHFAAQEAADELTSIERRGLGVYVLIMKDAPPWSAVDQDKAETLGKVSMTWLHDQMQEYGLSALPETPVHAVAIRHDTMTEADFNAGVLDGSVINAGYTGRANDWIKVEIARLLPPEDVRPQRMNLLALTGQDWQDEGWKSWTKGLGGGNEGRGGADVRSYMFHPSVNFSGDHWTDIDWEDPTPVVVWDQGGIASQNTAGEVLIRAVGSGVHEILHGVDVDHGVGSIGAGRAESFDTWSYPAGQSASMMESGNQVFPHDTDITAVGALQFYASQLGKGDFYYDDTGEQVHEIWSASKIRPDVASGTLTTGLGDNGLPYVTGVLAVRPSRSLKTWQNPAEAPVLAIANSAAGNYYKSRKSMGDVRFLGTEDGWSRYEFIVTLRDERFDPDTSLNFTVAVFGPGGTKDTLFSGKVNHLGQLVP